MSDTFTDSYGTRLRVHPPDRCAGTTCAVHAPSDHHMRAWPLHWRADRAIFERQCPHGVGHPDPDAAAYHAARGADFENIHGCDGCCTA